MRQTTRRATTTTFFYVNHMAAMVDSNYSSSEMQPWQENPGGTSRLDSPSPRLMAVDDEVDISFTLKKELEQSAFSLDVFNAPTIALSNFKADYYDIILILTQD